MLANWLAMLLIPLLGAALTNSFGRMVGDERHGHRALLRGGGRAGDRRVAGGPMRAPASAGTLPTVGAVWIGLLVGVILIIGGLTFLPALALGPIAEAFG